jgi:hypothetical protein
LVILGERLQKKIAGSKNCVMVKRCFDDRTFCEGGGEETFEKVHMSHFRICGTQDSTVPLASYPEIEEVFFQDSFVSSFNFLVLVGRNYLIKNRNSHNRLLIGTGSKRIQII